MSSSFCSVGKERDGKEQDGKRGKGTRSRGAFVLWTGPLPPFYFYRLDFLLVAESSLLLDWLLFCVSLSTVMRMLHSRSPPASNCFFFGIFCQMVLCYHPFLLI